MGLSYRQLDALSAAASGRSRLPPPTITRIRRAADDLAVAWMPASTTLLALSQMNELIVAILEGRARPPASFDPDIHVPRLEPLRTAAGEVMTLADLGAIVVGVPGIIEPAQLPMADREDLEALIPALGLIIERAIIDAGRSPLRDLPQLLALYPVEAERPLLSRVVHGDAFLTPEQLHLALPGLCYALSRFTGDSWTRERLLSAASSAAVT